MSSDTLQPEWSEIDDDQATVISKLEALSTTRDVLAKQGYVFDELTEEELQRKNRCQWCAKPIPIITICPFQPPFATPHAQQKYIAHENRMLEKSRCIHHSENQWGGKWQCCGRHMFAPGCQEADEHVPCDMADIRADWYFEYTPGLKERQIFVLHSRRPRHVKGRGENIRTAVALDCEMGTSVIGTSPLIKLSVVDFMTGEILINEFVIPNIDMLHYNTKYSGVTFKDMREARSNRNTLWGTDQARAELLKYVDAETFIVVHGGSNDLSALRLCHPPNKIIDTYTLEVNDPQVGEGVKKSLKEVCARRCNKVVQNKRLPNGQLAGHDPLEDAMAAREIVCTWMGYLDTSSDEASESSTDQYDEGEEDRHVYDYEVD